MSLVSSQSWMSAKHQAREIGVQLKYLFAILKDVDLSFLVWQKDFLLGVVHSATLVASGKVEDGAEKEDEAKFPETLERDWIWIWNWVVQFCLSFVNHFFAPHPHKNRQAHSPWRGMESIWVFVRCESDWICWIEIWRSKFFSVRFCLLRWTEGL